MFPIRHPLSIIGSTPNARGSLLGDDGEAAEDGGALGVGGGGEGEAQDVVDGDVVEGADGAEAGPPCGDDRVEVAEDDAALEADVEDAFAGDGAAFGLGKVEAYGVAGPGCELAQADVDGALDA